LVEPRVNARLAVLLAYIANNANSFSQEPTPCVGTLSNENNNEKVGV